MTIDHFKSSLPDIGLKEGHWLSIIADYYYKKNNINVNEYRAKIGASKFGITASIANLLILAWTKSGLLKNMPMYC